MAGYCTLKVILWFVTVNVTSMFFILTVPWVGMQCVIVIFPDDTH